MDPRSSTATAVRTFLTGFHDEVARHPSAPAITQGAVTLTYADLDRRSTALSQRLAARGVAPDTLVGLLLERTPDLVVALVGILKAGGAYVPLDPTYPAERIAFMLADAAPAVVVTQASLRDALPDGTPTMAVDDDVEDDGGRNESTGESLPVPAIADSTRAYVIYTSGSTGRPKGVEITHGAVANLLESFRDVPGMHRGDVVLAHTTLSFDIAVIELWLPLFTGARIVLAGPGRGTDGRAIAALLAEHRVTFLQATPSLWKLLLDAGWRDGRGITALSGGEPLSRELASALLATGADLWNVYGPTETTVWSSMWRVEPGGPILIGRPIRETELYVLDADLNPVPPGETGEVCIGGTGLARGYLNQPSLTAEKFVPHPFRAEPGTRLYRTGDVARLRGDRIECLGRLDHQVKIDGFRIEPGEIEAALEGHEGVHRAVVRAVEREPGDTRLVAYVVPGPSEVTRDDLLTRARAQLPPYMVPSAFIVLDALPLTPNGKIDRAALPAPDWTSAPRPRSADLRTPLQRRLAQMWCDILGLADVSADVSFFDIGGRSRLGAQLFARIETEIGVRLPLALLFEAPTIAALARAIERSDQAVKLWRPLVPIRGKGARGPLFCVHPVGGNVLAYRDLAARLGADVRCFGLQAVGLDGVTPPCRSVEDMARRYLDEIRSVQPEGPYHLCGFSFGGLVAFEMAVRLQDAHQPVRLLALLDTEFPEELLPLPRWMREMAPLRGAYAIAHRLTRHARSLGRLGPRGYVAATREDGPDQEPTPPEDERFWLAADRVRRVNARAADAYVPRRFDGTLTYFRASQEGANDTRTDRRERWRCVVRDVEIVEVQGGHSDLRLEPQVGIVAREILARLA